MQHPVEAAAVCFAAALIIALVIPMIILRIRRRSFRPAKGSAFCDLLEYAVLAEDNIVVLKSGGMTAVYKVILPDLSMLTGSRMRHLYLMLNNAVMKAGGDFCLNFDLIRSRSEDYIPYREYEDPILDHFEEERRRSFADEGCFSSELFISITDPGNSVLAKTVEKLFTESDNLQGRETALRAVRAFKDVCEGITSTLALCFEIKPAAVSETAAGGVFDSACLKKSGKSGKEAEIFVPYAACRNNETLSFLKRCIYGRNISAAASDKAVFLDSVLSVADFTHGFTPQIGDTYICAVAVDGLPSETYQGMLSRLTSLPFEYRFSTRFISFDNLKASLLIEKHYRFWSQKSRSFCAQLFDLKKSRINRNAVNMAEDAEAAKAAADSGGVVFGSYTACVILHDKDRELLKAKAADTVRVLEDCGLGCRVETVNATEAFLGSLPGHIKENLRRPTVSQEVLTDLLSLSSPYTGEKEAVNPLMGSHRPPLMQVRTAGSGCCCLNLHDKDLGNTLVTGPSGSGKSVFLGSLIINTLRYRDARVRVFDRGYSFYALCKALNGKHVSLSEDTGVFCPLDRLDTTSDFEYAAGFIETLLRAACHKISPGDLKEIRDILHILHTSRNAPATLSDFHLLCTSQGMKEAIAPFLKKKGRESLLDGNCNEDFSGRLTVFECGELCGSENINTVPVLKQIFRLLQRDLDGRPLTVIADEAWFLLQDRLFASELISMFKTFRKFNANVVLATQNLADLKECGCFGQILDCAKTRIFMPDSDAEAKSFTGLYEEAGLNIREIAALSAAVPKRDRYFVKGDRRCMFSELFAEDELALLSMAGNGVKAETDLLFKKYGRDFYRYLKPF